MITTPGLYDGVDETAYHDGSAFAEPTISCSDCKLLAKPGGAALWHWRQGNPEPPRKEFDVGSAAHALILGTGPQIVCVPGEWRTKEKKAEVADWRAQGILPLHSADYRAVFGMYKAVTSHPVAAGLLASAPHREATGLVEGPGGQWLRCRFDAIGGAGIVDLKTCQSADPATFARKAIELGYHQQAAWYRDMAQELGVTAGPFRFIAVEKTPPYLVSVIELDEATEDLGRDANQRAIDTYRHCLATDEWPGYPTDITTASAPPWAFRDAQDSERLDPSVEQELLDLLKGTKS
jgi:hypothetical protein